MQKLFHAAMCFKQGCLIDLLTSCLLLFLALLLARNFLRRFCRQRQMQVNDYVHQCVESLQHNRETYRYGADLPFEGDASSDSELMLLEMT